MNVRSRSSNETIVLQHLIIFVLLLQQLTSAQKRLLRKHRSEGGAWEQQYEELEKEGLSRLSDVWLCFGMAFGWALFLIRAIMGRARIKRYESEGLHVKGSVLESTVNPDGYGHMPGIPTYHALVDYVYHDETNESTVQIRKAFPTERLLDKGFSNVELLVLPDEPASGVLINEWEREFEDEKKHEAETRYVTFFSWILGVLFILLSIFGAWHAVRLLPENKKTSGWVSLGIGIALLGPVSFTCYTLSRIFHRTVGQTIKDGIFSCQTNIHCIRPNQHHDVYSAYGAPRDGSGKRAIDAYNNNRAQTENHKKTQDYYFVHLPKRGDPNVIRSTSTVSSLSTKSFPNHMLNDSTLSESQGAVVKGCMKVIET